MANFGGVYFLHFFPKTTLNASKLQFLFKKSTFVGFRGKIAVLRHLDGFLAKSEESRPPLKWPILGASWELGHLAFLYCGLPKNVSQLRNGWFFEKMPERRPPLKWPILGGGLFSDIFFLKNQLFWSQETFFGSPQSRSAKYAIMSTDIQVSF